VDKSSISALFTQPLTRLRHTVTKANYSSFRYNCLLSVTSTLESGLVIRMVTSEQHGTFLTDFSGCKVKQYSLNCYSKQLHLMCIYFTWVWRD